MGFNVSPGKAVGRGRSALSRYKAFMFGILIGISLPLLCISKLSWSRMPPAENLHRWGEVLVRKILSDRERLYYPFGTVDRFCFALV